MNTPTPPGDVATSWVLLAATRRELSRSGFSRPGTKPTTLDATRTSTGTPAAAAAPNPAPATFAYPPDLPQQFNEFVYTPIYTAVSNWVDTPGGQVFAGFVNTVTGSYAIGDGSAGTSASDPDGTNGGWLFGDGGDGWNSTVAGVAGGDGGSAGLFGNGGVGGVGGTGAAGGIGGDGGSLMGLGGAGGDGGAATGTAVGGAGGDGGTAPGLLFGIGGTGGDGNDGGVGGVGGDGGNATGLLGSGGRGGNGGDGSLTGRLPALGGAGGTIAQWSLGNHGEVGRFGNQAGVNLVPGHPTISTTGSWFTDEDGRVVILRGMNVVDITGPIRTPSEEGFSEDDAAFLAANGFNVVRLGVDWERLQPEPGVYDEEYLNELDETVAMLGDHGIVTVLDFHQNVPPTYVTGELPPSNIGFPLDIFFDSAKNAALDKFWANDPGPTGAGQLNEYAAMVQYLANHYNGNPNVVGIEIMNEPRPGNQFLPSILGSSYHEAQQLTPFYNQVATAIRSVNPDATIFFEPSVAATAMVPVRLGTVHDPNSALSFHDYAFVNLGGLVLPFVNVIANTAADYAKAHNIPAIMTEFGSSSNPSSLNQTMAPADQHLLSWTEWSYANTTYRGVDGTVEWLVDDPSKPLEGDNVNWDNLKILTRPYAQTIAGTPQSMSYNENDGTFKFSYTTDRVDGQGRFAPGSETIISVPDVHYPNGYTVSVEGGTVVSTDNGKIIIASGDVTTVTVTVTPNTSV